VPDSLPSPLVHLCRVGRAGANSPLAVRCLPEDGGCGALPGTACSPVVPGRGTPTTETTTTAAEEPPETARDRPSAEPPKGKTP
jgi:hypothetical protein